MRYLQILVLVGVMLACEVITEDDISDAEVILLSPGNDVLTSEDSISFWWERVNGATDYHFRLVSPSFDSALQVFADTITQENLFTLKLPTGQSYEWEVSALNGGYATGFSIRSFRIEAIDTTKAIDITEELISVLAPIDSFETNESEVSFWWDEVEGAESYQFRLVSPSFENVELVVSDSIVTGTLLKMNLAQVKKYQWEVRAINEVSSTVYTRRSLSILEVEDGVKDISEEIVTLLAPASDVSIESSEVNFWWEQLEGAESYHFRLVSPSFANAVEVYADSTIVENQFEIILPEGSSYEWEVKATNELSSTELSRQAFMIAEREIDLSLVSVPLLAPADSLEINKSEINFWWEEVEGADSYQFILVRPDFDTPEELVLDSSVMTNSLVVTLDSGRYAWGVRAKNSSSQSELSIRNLYVNIPN